MFPIGNNKGKIEKKKLIYNLLSKQIQQQSAKWHDALIKKKIFHEGDWALLYDSRFQDFPGKLQTRWLGPYEIQEVHDNGTLTLATIAGS